MVNLKPITKENTKQILEQMENSFYKIESSENKIGIGCFCHFKIKNINVPVLIIDFDFRIGNNNNNAIKVYLNNNFFITVELGKSIYEIEECNIIIIQIKVNEDTKINYLEIDDLLLKKKSELNYYCNEQIYMVYCNKLENISVSYDIIRDINNTDIILDNKINSKFKYSLIFNLSNNKLIGIKKINCYYKGIFFNSIINRFIHNAELIKRNEIEMIIKIDKKEIGKEIYFLANKYYDIEKNKYILCHEKLKELNTHNTEIYINNVKCEYNKFFIPEKEGEYHLKIKLKFNLTDCSFMFSGCTNIKYINLSNLNTKYVINMKRMFNECKNVEYINLTSFDTKNVIDMSYMFNKCYRLKYLNLLNFNTKKVLDKTLMIGNCKNLMNVDLSTFIIKNNEIISGMYQTFKKQNIYELNRNNSIIKKEFYIIFLGASGCGAKTNLIRRLINESFDEMSMSTLISSYVSKSVDIGSNEKIILNLWDTAGQENYFRINAKFIRDKDCAVLGYSIDNFNSFEEIKDHWYPIIKELIPSKLIYMIGNNKDLESERLVSEEEAIDYAEKNNLRFFEISCKTGEGIDEFLDDLVYNLIIPQN